MQYFNDWQAMQLLRKAYNAGVSIDALREFAFGVRNWTELRNGLEDLAEGAPLQVPQQTTPQPLGEQPQIAKSLPAGTPPKPYGSEYRLPLFERLCTEVPELRKLEDDVIRSTEFLMMEDPRPTNQGDTDIVWYTLFKPRVEELVGYTAKASSEIAGTTEAYDAVTQYLYRALAPSEETLGEDSGMDEYQRRFEAERESWDGDEDTKPGFISTERIMETLVNRLHLQITGAYRTRVND
ncbi:MAG TPA: hypothetical protein VLY24_21160 [Bryobacteraceae bacterium]|nr:hypothetical protein [Bryobacteraceae bacterium]